VHPKALEPRRHHDASTGLQLAAVMMIRIRITQLFAHGGGSSPLRFCGNPLLHEPHSQADRGTCPSVGLYVHYKSRCTTGGDSAETAATRACNCGVLVVAGGRVLPPIEPNPLFESICTFENIFESSPKNLKADEERAVSNLESTPKESTRK
jgi:hypothetical protein